MDINPEDKKKVESVLFTTGKLMTLDEIGQPLEITDHEYLKELLDSLKIDYSSRDSALHIQQVDDKYRLNIRKEYGYLANKLLGSTELEGPAIKTLAIIAMKNPALQSEIIKIRGNKAYDHIAVLREQNLIATEKHGRTNLVTLTPHFYDYFDTAAAEVKQKFEAMQKQLAEKKQSGQPEEPKIEPENLIQEAGEENKQAEQEAQA